jgi:pimeloyl-[acyl-carrier protein] methyl ester esterase
MYKKTMSNQKPIVYLIHGWGMNQAVWTSTAEKLSDYFEIKPLDLAGFGSKSTQALLPYTLESISQELLSDLAEPGWIIGWSLGGLVAQYIAINDPEKVTGLITVASSPYFTEQDNWPGIKPEVLTAFQTQLAENYQKTLSQFLAIQAMGSPTAKNDIKQLKQQLLTYPQPNAEALKGGLEILAEADLRQDVGNISHKTLRIYGKLDSLVPRRAIKQISQLQNNAEHTIFQQASHAPFISHQDEFIEEIKRFILK